MKKATLVMYGKTASGWRRGSIPSLRNGRPKTGVMIVAGQEVPVENPIYQVREYRDRQAKYTSIGPDYREAREMLDRVQTARRAEHYNAKLKTPKTAEQEAAEKAANRKTLLQAKDEFLDKKAPLGLSRHSHALHRVIGDFVEYTGKTYLDELVTTDVSNYFDSLRSKYTSRTRMTRYMTLRGWLKTSGVNLSELIDDATHKRLRSKPAPRTEPYSDVQVQRLLTACDEYHKVAFNLLLATGMREREATNLTWSQIDFANNKIVIRGEQSIHHKGKVIKFMTKTGNGRTLPLFPSLKSMLLEWREKHPKSIFVIGTPKDLPNGHLLRGVKRFALDAGLNCDMCASCAKYSECEHVYLHKFRHTFAHRCLKKFSIHQVSKWLGSPLFGARTVPESLS